MSPLQRLAALALGLLAAPAAGGLLGGRSGRLLLSGRTASSRAAEEGRPKAPKEPHVRQRQPSAGPCKSPQTGDKIVYFVRHGKKVLNEEDPSLSKLGKVQAKHLRMEPLLAAALSANASHRAQLLLVSPLKRTMETALLGFGGLFPPEQWLLDPDIMESEISDKPKDDANTALLASFDAPTLLEQYRKLSIDWADDKGDHKARYKAKWDRFVDLLRTRPERRFVVVSHHWFIENTGHNLNEGQVGISALAPSGEFRQLDAPSCWPDFQDEWQKIIKDATLATKGKR